MQNKDIEMIMDFIKLSMTFNKIYSINKNYATDILDCQKRIIDLLPIAQSNRMALIYNVMNNVYQKQSLIFNDYLLVQNKIE